MKSPYKWQSRLHHLWSSCHSDLWHHLSAESTATVRYISRCINLKDRKRIARDPDYIIVVMKELSSAYIPLYHDHYGNVLPWVV